jgi:desulfoferrodoxin (superoxide reductase-like protein)
MLLCEKRSIGNMASHFSTFIVLALLLVSIMLTLPAAANAPSQVSLVYDSQNQSLKVTTTHAIATSTHYVYKISIDKNGEQVLTREYKSQSGPTFAYDFPINATKGDVIKATAYCIIAGSKSAEITV